MRYGGLPERMSNLVGVVMADFSWCGGLRSKLFIRCGQRFSKQV